MVLLDLDLCTSLADSHDVRGTRRPSSGHLKSTEGLGLTNHTGECARLNGDGSRRGDARETGLGRDENGLLIALLQEDRSVRDTVGLQRQKVLANSAFR